MLLTKYFIHTFKEFAAVGGAVTVAGASVFIVVATSCDVIDVVAASDVVVENENIFLFVVVFHRLFLFLSTATKKGI